MKNIICSVALMLVSLAAFSQKVRLNAYGAYVFDDKFDTYYSSNVYLNGKIKGGFQWGAGLEYEVRPDYGVELIYFRQDTQAPIYLSSSSSRDQTIELGLNYIMLGGVRYLSTVGDGKIEPYGGLMLGMVIYENKEPQGTQESSATKFSWGARLGTNIWFSDSKTIGLKLQAYLLSGVQGKIPK